MAQHNGGRNHQQVGSSTSASFTQPRHGLPALNMDEQLLPLGPNGNGESAVKKVALARFLAGAPSDVRIFM